MADSDGQGPGGAPLDRLSEDELIERGRRAMLRAASLPLRSTGRGIQWAVYDTYAAELRRRAAVLLAGRRAS